MDLFCCRYQIKDVEYKTILTKCRLYRIHMNPPSKNFIIMIFFLKKGEQCDHHVLLEQYHEGISDSAFMGLGLRTQSTARDTGMTQTSFFPTRYFKKSCSTSKLKFILLNHVACMKIPKGARFVL